MPSGSSVTHVENNAQASTYSPRKRANDSKAYDVLLNSVKIGYVVSSLTESYRYTGRIIYGSRFPEALGGDGDHAGR